VQSIALNPKSPELTGTHAKQDHGKDAESFAVAG
jgi:hypothetical protein